MLKTGSILDFELDTTLGGVDTSDLINVNSANGLTITGSTLNLINAGAMTFGTYTLIDYSGTLAGSVSNLTLGTTPAGFAYSLVNNTGNTSIDLRVTAAGDYDFNGIVDAADYVVWSHRVGWVVPRFSNGDANGNGFVEVVEYQPWRENYGRSYDSGSGAVATAIPEPSALVLMLATGLIMMLQQDVRCRYDFQATRGSDG